MFNVTVFMNVIMLAMLLPVGIGALAFVYQVIKGIR
jgi:hypothetical protein